MRKMEVIRDIEMNLRDYKDERDIVLLIIKKGLTIEIEDDEWPIWGCYSLEISLGKYRDYYEVKKLEESEEADELYNDIEEFAFYEIPEKDVIIQGEENKDMVRICCYDKYEIMEREEAKKFYGEAMRQCDPGSSEFSRYAKIYCDLMTTNYREFFDD